MSNESELLSDPVFQLNVFLWALQDHPDEVQIRPVLRQAGYYLNSIGRRVLMPDDDAALAALRELTGSSGRASSRPDLWLSHSTDPVHPIIELKAHGFSPTSSNRTQALKLIAAAADLAPSLGEPEKRQGHVIYATTGVDADRLSSTLRVLAQELDSVRVATAPTGVIGLSMESEGVAISSPDPSELPSPLAQALRGHSVVLERDGDNDPQPLYFVPWMPGIKDSQAPELHEAGLRELTARVLVQLLATVGQARPPTTLVLDSARLLRRATLGVFEQWRDGDRHEFSCAVDKIVERTLRSVVDVRHAPEGHLEVDLPNTDVHDAVITRIERADPADPTTNLKAVVEEHPTLFNGDIEVTSSS